MVLYSYKYTMYLDYKMLVVDLLNHTNSKYLMNLLYMLSDYLIN